MNDEKDDRVIRERRFKIGANIDIGDLGLGDDSEEVAEPNSKYFNKNETVEVDEALGDVFDPFKEPLERKQERYLLTEQ